MIKKTSYLLIILLISSLTVVAQNPDAKVTKVDFAVLEIAAGKCICDLEGLEIFYMNKMSIYTTIALR